MESRSFFSEWDPWDLQGLGYSDPAPSRRCPVCGEEECRGDGPLEDKWYVGCFA